MKNCRFLFLIFVFSKLSAQWAPSSYPTDFYNITISAYKNKDTLVLADAVRGFYFSNDGGQIFSKKSSSFSSPNRFYFFGDTLISSTGNLNYSFDNGETWQRQFLKSISGDTLVASNLRQYNLFENGKGFALTGASNSKLQLFLTNDFGNTWVKGDSENVGIPVFISGGMLNVRNAYTFGSTFITHHPFNLKKFWIFEEFGVSVREEDLSLKLENLTVIDFAFENVDTGLILCRANDNSLKVYRTTDRLKSVVELWNESTVAPRSICYAPDNGLSKGFYIIGTSDGSFFSKDKGISWLPLNDGASHYYLNFFNASVGISSSILDSDRIKFFDGSILNSINKNHVIESNSLSLFPNPSRNEVELSGVLAHELQELSLFSLDGSLVQRFEPSLKLNLAAIQTGVYVLRISTQNATGFLKVVKE